MKKTLISLLALLSIASTSVAEDSIAVGVRYGGEINSNSVTKNSEYYEGFADIYLNRLISIGASISYLAADINNGGTITNQKSYPVTALFKVHAPIPIVQPYAGLGQAIIFHDHKSTNGSPVVFAGADISFIPLLFLNVEYRHQFNDGNLDFIAGGVGVKF
jgi:hypothetical protein